MDQLEFKAIYGTFDHDMIPIEVIDCTNVVAENFFSKDKRIIIPARIDFNEHFGNPVLAEQRKFLQIQAGNRKYNIIEDDYHLDIVVDPYESKKKIKIVYYAYINRESNWQGIIYGQLLQVKSYGIFDEAELYVHITDTADIFDDAINLIIDICKEAIISLSNQNHYEYPGIKLVYDLATQDPDVILIYFHTKGISSNIESRTLEDVGLLSGTFENWRRNLQAFKDEKIDKIGLFPAAYDADVKKYYGAHAGWIYFNFWYVRASYLINRCERPIIETNRWRFETWLAGPYNDELITVKDCYNLYDEENQAYFSLRQMQAGLAKLLESVIKRNSI